MPPSSGSPVTHGRGSKRGNRAVHNFLYGRPSHTGADRNTATFLVTTGAIVARHTRARIETLARRMSRQLLRSPVTHGRGSKRNLQAICLSLYTSPVTHGRGSKPPTHPEACEPNHVARHTRARIETSPSRRLRKAPGRPSHTGADRNELGGVLQVAHTRRPSHTGADRNSNSSPTNTFIDVARHTRARIETSPPSASPHPLQVARHTRARIETLAAADVCANSYGRPSHTGADRNILALTSSIDGASPVTHGRGSKQTQRRDLVVEQLVARHTRARIETNDARQDVQGSGRPSHTGADRNLSPIQCSSVRSGRPSHTGADRNTHQLYAFYRARSPVTHGRGSKLCHLRISIQLRKVARHTRARIETRS